ncbi:AraC family transcriptional regulator [Actinoplanes awajinensis subsp. mycoplanecinus]|uniref:AraC family transcriptional regulator n=1 Tax=Actinoplanes awajinensis subsp. mycoplanecinus TaxID=135947 RepID=A0A117MS07_9ACTN|nr:AraC family transcriptional regulator [Actinoplanes awajinensis]KUL32591.1 AraC family transcriptional regulator [Actinoplanes awajinensis subsp. mycoplanecinus]
MPVLTHRAERAPDCEPPTWAGVGGCALPVAAGAATGLLECHALVLTTTGPLLVDVDFTSHLAGPGTLLWVRPGQAIHFDIPGERPAGDDKRRDDAVTIVFRAGLFASEELPGLTPDDPDGPARTPLVLPDPEVFRAAMDHLAADAAGPPGRIATALLHHQLAALLLRVRLLDSGGDDPGNVESRTFERFRRRLEDGYPSSRRVEDYAAELNCSVRTLTRASLSVTGRTAKQVVDDRVALQARRLLAATDLSVAEVGRILGFGEPTNFGRFFHRETALSPGQFRARFADRPGGIPGQRLPAD